MISQCINNNDFLFYRNPNCKGNLNRGKSKETYKYSKGFCHEGHFIQHLKSSHECEKYMKKKDWLVTDQLAIKKFTI